MEHPEGAGQLAHKASGWRVAVTGGSGFIGSHLVRRLQDAGAQVLVLDLAPPYERAALPRWAQVDVLDRSALQETLDCYQPSHLVHLAALVSTAPDLTVADYRVNTDGTANVLRAAASCPSIERVVVTSTQFVCRPGHVPLDDLDVDPETPYGHSKVVTENLTRLMGTGSAVWTVVRPTTIWGPWDQRYRSSFYALLRRGWYLHPDTGPSVRSYGYVGNVAWQMEQILGAPTDTVAERVLYLGDRPMDIRDYAEEFLRQLGAGPARTVPLGLAKAGARVGDLLDRAGVKFPITSTRLRFMTIDYPVPIEETFEVLGEPPYSLADGVADTVEWLRTRWWQDG